MKKKLHFRSAQRVQASLLAPLEKRCLLWLAQRMPRWVSSDGLTLLGLLGMFGAGFCYWRAPVYREALLGVIVCIAVNWFGDSLDGTMARFRKQLRPRYGFYVDHVVDTFGALFLLGGIALSGYMSVLCAAGLLVAYYILCIEVFLATYTMGKFEMAFGGIGPTELRILLAAGTLALYFHAGTPRVWIAGESYLLFDVGAVVAMAGILMMTIASTARHGMQLYRTEPLEPVAASWSFRPSPGGGCVRVLREE